MPDKFLFTSSLTYRKMDFWSVNNPIHSVKCRFIFGILLSTLRLSTIHSVWEAHTFCLETLLHLPSELYGGERSTLTVLSAEYSFALFGI